MTSFSSFWKWVLLLLCALVLSVNGKISVKANDLQFADQPAAFGPGLTPQGIRGYLVQPPNGLEHGCKPFTLSSSQPAIILVLRGNCSFLTKVRAMQLSGAMAVIVGDYHQQSELVSMYADRESDDIDIPSVFVDFASYSYLVRISEYDTQTLVELIPNPTTYVPMVKTALSILPTLLFFVVILYSLLDSFYFKSSSPSSSSSSPFATTSIVQVDHRLDNLTSKTFHIKQVAENEATLCAICLDDFEDEQELMVLPCRHAFHGDCIKPWLLKTAPHLCPICKAQVACSCDNELETSESDTEHRPYRLVLSWSSWRPVRGWRSNQEPISTTPLLISTSVTQETDSV